MNEMTIVFILVGVALFLNIVAICLVFKYVLDAKRHRTFNDTIISDLSSQLSLTKTVVGNHREELNSLNNKVANTEETLKKVDSVADMYLKEKAAIVVKEFKKFIDELILDSDKPQKEKTKTNKVDKNVKTEKTTTKNKKQTKQVKK